MAGTTTRSASSRRVRSWPGEIVKPDLVDELLGRRLKEHPAYFGTMVWVLAMLGLWLQSRRL